MFIAGLAFLLALLLTVYPLISTSYNEKHQSVIHTQYLEQVEQIDYASIQKQLNDATAYNRKLNSGLIQADAFSQESVSAAAVGYDEILNPTGNGIMGYVYIPSILVNLPIYHGTEASTLERGIGHLLGSSLPVGGISTHCVLTGHSGMASSKMFTDLTKLKEGDIFYVTVLQRTLAYQINQIERVLPYETELLTVVPGMDYCTLVTCTPLGVNSHRLLVRGVRVPFEDAQQIQEERSVEEPESESEWDEEYYSGLVLGIIIIVIILIILYFVTNGGRKGKYEAR